MAAKFHEVLLGRGKSTLLSRQQTRSHALADIQQVRKFTKAAGAELSHTFMVLEGVALRFAAQIARVDLGAGQGQAAVRDLERVGKLLELVVKCQKEARLCLSASAMLSQDLRAFGYVGEAVGGGAGGNTSLYDLIARRIDTLRRMTVAVVSGVYGWSVKFSSTGARIRFRSG